MSNEEFRTQYGPWAVVAGASDGTGVAFAEELAGRGVDLVLVVRRQSLLDEVATRLGVETRVVVLDRSVEDAGRGRLPANVALATGPV